MRASILFTAILLLGTGCLKTDVDPNELTNNPFDPGYTGPNVFAFDSTWTEVVIGPPTYNRQVFQFVTNSDLFLAPQTYDVYVEDMNNGTSTYVPQQLGGGDTIRYYRLDFTFGEETCIRAALSNNFHYGRQETLCGTLQ